MGKIILIKHSMPNVTSDIPSKKWTLSEEGIINTKLLALKLEKFNFNKIYSSDEPKAMETAQILGNQFLKTVEVIKGIHEQERESNRTIYPRDQWKKLMKKFFDFPDELIFGDETANAAKERFSTAIHNLIESNPRDEDIVVVTHGVVMSLFISKYNDIDIFNVWDTLGLPSYAELNANDFRLNDIVNLD